jgi:hypothetical protein
MGESGIRNIPSRGGESRIYDEKKYNDRGTES